MKSFKTFLLEMPATNEVSFENRSYMPKVYPKAVSKSRLPSGHRVYHYDDNHGTHHFWAAHDPNKPHIYLQTTKSPSDDFHIEQSVVKRHDTPIKGIDFYHHLITNHGIKLLGVDHSPGTQKLWKRLFTAKNIKVTPIDTFTHNPVKMSTDNPDQFYRPGMDRVALKAERA